MTKKTTRRQPKATQQQVNRIEVLGQQLYKDRWEGHRSEVFSSRLTPNRARKIIIEFQRILGGKV